MEIRSGYGTTGNRVTGPVRVGDPITLVVYMRSQFGTQNTQNEKNNNIEIKAIKNKYELCDL